jgi:hypothetical protein
MAKIILINKFTPKLVRENIDIIFVFGDNLSEKGKGGQAVIRDFKNTIGVPTKKYPSNHKSSFMTDDELKQNKIVINKAFTKIITKIKEGHYIALPAGGLGTGLAKLAEKAPETNKYLLNKLEKLKKDYGVLN